MASDFLTQDLPPATCLSDEELLKYAQMKIDVRARLPFEWQMELLQRLTKALDRLDALTA